MDPNTIAAVLQACCSPNTAERQAGEEELRKFKYVKGQMVTILQVVCATQVDLHIRQAAAIHFKMVVVKDWDEEERDERRKAEGSLSDEDRAVIRTNILEAIIHSPPLLRSQLAECIKSIISCDYPQRWPELDGAILNLMGTQDPPRLHCALLTLRLLARKYEYKDADERKLLVPVMDRAFPPLLALTQHLLSLNSSSLEVAELLKLVLKTFWSTVYLEMPQRLLVPETFIAWMNIFQALVTITFPEEAQPRDRVDREAWPWWKVKKWALHICNRLFSRYGDPKESRNAQLRQFAQRFASEWSCKLLEGFMGQLALLPQGRFLPDRVVNYLLQFLGNAVMRKTTYAYMKPHVQSLLLNVVFPILCFNERDMELWRDDPHEYIRKGYDIIEDMYSPRTGAMNFIQEVVRCRPDNLHPFLSFVVSVFTRCSPGTPPESRPYGQMDGALLAIGTLSEKLAKTEPYKAQLEHMLVTYVLPEFKNPLGHIRAKACWVSGMYADIQFQDMKNFNMLFQSVVERLADPELPVRVDAIVALRCFVEATEDLANLRPILPQLLDECFKLMNEVENEDLVFTLETLVEKFGEEISPFAVGLTTNLVAAFWKCLESNESAEDEEPAGALASLGCLRAIISILDSVSSVPQLYPQLEELLFPLISRMMSEEGADVLEEILEMVSYFTYYGDTVSERMWQLWPGMVRAIKDWAVDYFENFLVPMDNFISKGTERFLAGTAPNYLEDTYALCHHLLADENIPDMDCKCAVQLLECVLLNCRGRVDQWVEPFLRTAGIRLAKRDTEPFLRDLLVGTYANAIYYNPQLALAALARLNATEALFTLWVQMLDKRTKEGGRTHFKREHDKKVNALALATLFTLPVGALPESVAQGMQSVLRVLLQLLGDLKEQRAARIKAQEEEEDEEAESEDGDSDNFVEDEDEEEGADKVAADGKLIGMGDHIIGGRGGFGGGDDDDDAFSLSGWSEEDDDASSPLDDIDPWIYFAEAMGQFGQQDPAKAAALQGALDFKGQALAMGLTQYAQQRREEIAKEKAEEAAEAAGAQPAQ